MNHVRQADRYGCGLACVAMVAGLTYAEVRGQIGGWFNAPERRGVTHYVVLEMLGQLGFTYRFLWRTDQRTYEDREPWPPEPFAPAHVIGAFPLAAVGSLRTV